MEWISIKDRLPEHNQEILISDGEFIQLSCFYEWKNESGFSRSTWMKATHWMPLPEPPDEEKELKCERCGKPAQKRYVCVGIKCDDCWEKRYYHID